MKNAYTLEQKLLYWTQQKAFAEQRIAKIKEQIANEWYTEYKLERVNEVIIDRKTGEVIETSKESKIKKA